MVFHEVPLLISSSCLPLTQSTTFSRRDRWSLKWWHISSYVWTRLEALGTSNQNLATWNIFSIEGAHNSLCLWNYCVLVRWKLEKLFKYRHFPEGVQPSPKSFWSTLFRRFKFGQNDKEGGWGGGGKCFTKSFGAFLKVLHCWIPVKESLIVEKHPSLVPQILEHF